MDLCRILVQRVVFDEALWLKPDRDLSQGIPITVSGSQTVLNSELSSFTFLFYP